MGVPRETIHSSIKGDREVPKASTVSVGEVGNSDTCLVGSIDRPCAGVTLHPAGNRQIYILKRVESSNLPIDWISTSFELVGETSQTILFLYTSNLIK